MNIENLKNIYQQLNKNDKTKIDAANNIALELFRDFPDEAMNYLNEANQWAKEISYQEGLSKNLWIQGRTKALNDKMGSMSLFEKALDIAKKSNYQEGICNAQTNIAILYTDLSQYGKSDSLFNEIIPIAEKLNDHTILSSIYTNMSRNPEREGKYFEAIDLLLKGAIYAQASNNLLLEGNAYTSIGRCYHKQLKLKEALENYQLSLALFEQAGNISGQITILINMAGVQFMQKEFVDALETLDKAQVLAEQTNTSQLPMIFINKGKAYSHLKDPKTFEYMEKALALSSEGNLGNRIEILQSLAKEHIKHNEFDKAKDYLDDAYKLAVISQSEHSLSSVWFTTALYYNYINQYNISNNYLNKALEIARKLKTNDMIKEIMSMYVDNYSKLGNYKNALDYYADYKNLNDTIFNEKNIRELALMESSYEYEKEKKEYELQQAKNEIKIRTQRYIITGVSITTLLVIGLLFMYYRSTKLKKHILILQLEKTNREVEMREQEIAAAKLRLVQNAERDAQCLKLLHNIEDEIDSSSKSSMRPLINYFKNQSDDSSWQEFEAQFIKVSPQYYEKLNTLYPNLTPNERKLCVFLKLNMSSKEINKITFQSEEALKKARLRLRKKLNLERETNLATFLQSL